MTGPDEAANGSYYVYAEASYPREEGDTAVLTTEYSNLQGMYYIIMILAEILSLILLIHIDNHIFNIFRKSLVSAIPVLYVWGSHRDITSICWG